MKTITVSEKSFEKIVLLIRYEIKVLEQQIREQQYILENFNSGEYGQNKEFHQGIIASTEQKKAETQKLLDSILSQ